MDDGAAAGAGEKHRALVAAARAMIPDLRARAMRAEEARRLPEETVAALAEAGILRMLRPARWDGFELDYGAIQLDVARELGRGCGSTAWVATVVACHDWILGMFPPEAQEDVWGKDRDALLVSAFAPEMSETRIEPAEGGYVLRGRWRFASGCDYCAWAILGGPVPQGEGPPENLWFVVPRADWTIDDTWFSPGLAGTGSKDIVIERAFVPAHRTLATAPLRDGGPSPGSAVNPSHIYRLPLMAVFPYNICAPAIGIARGMIEAFAESVSGRLTRTGGARMAEFPIVQHRTSESAVEVDCADLLLQRDAADLNAVARAGGSFPPERRATYRRDLAYAALLCRRAAERLMATTGAHGLVRDSVEQRALRDLFAVTAQIGLQWDVNAPAYAQTLFGLELSDRRM